MTIEIIENLSSVLGVFGLGDQISVVLIPGATFVRRARDTCLHQAQDTEAHAGPTE